HDCISLFHSHINLGISIGRNYLINKTTEPWLLIVDNDITAKNPRGWVESFNEQITARPQYDVFTLRIYNVHEKAYVRPVKIVKWGRTVIIETTESLLQTVSLVQVQLSIEMFLKHLVF
ncbi:MAG: hypothetical protein M3040_09740, partial [Bacteroidota bacterium]|nr:hypothetical protein [Bacteroidota bacterium]